VRLLAIESSKKALKVDVEGPAVVGGCGVGAASAEQLAMFIKHGACATTRGTGGRTGSRLNHLSAHYVHGHTMESRDSKVASVPVEELKTALQREAVIIDRFAGGVKLKTNNTSAQNKRNAQTYIKKGKIILSDLSRSLRKQSNGIPGSKRPSVLPGVTLDSITVEDTANSILEKYQIPLAISEFWNEPEDPESYWNQNFSIPEISMPAPRQSPEPKAEESEDDFTDVVPSTLPSVQMKTSPQFETLPHVSVAPGEDASSLRQCDRNDSHIVEDGSISDPPTGDKTSSQEKAITEVKCLAELVKHSGYYNRRDKRRILRLLMQSPKRVSQSACRAILRCRDAQNIHVTEEYYMQILSVIRPTQRCGGKTMKHNRYPSP
jgi:hypothetical protein